MGATPLAAASSGSEIVAKQYVFMKIPIIELFELALDMLIWHLFFCFFRHHIFDLKARSKKHIAKWPRFPILTMLRQEVWHP
jgi:hypothetical protein